MKLPLRYTGFIMESFLFLWVKHGILNGEFGCFLILASADFFFLRRIIMIFLCSIGSGLWCGDYSWAIYHLTECIISLDTNFPKSLPRTTCHWERKKLFKSKNSHMFPWRHMMLIRNGKTPFDFYNLWWLLSSVSKGRSPSLWFIALLGRIAVRKKKAGQMN